MAVEDMEDTAVPINNHHSSSKPSSTTASAVEENDNNMNKQLKNKKRNNRDEHVVLEQHASEASPSLVGSPLPSPLAAHAPSSFSFPADNQPYLKKSRDSPPLASSTTSASILSSASSSINKKIPSSSSSSSTSSTTSFNHTPLSFLMKTATEDDPMISTNNNNNSNNNSTSTTSTTNNSINNSINVIPTKQPTSNIVNILGSDNSDNIHHSFENFVTKERQTMSPKIDKPPALALQTPSPSVQSQPRSPSPVAMVLSQSSSSDNISVPKAKYYEMENEINLLKKQQLQQQQIHQLQPTPTVPTLNLNSTTTGNFQLSSSNQPHTPTTPQTIPLSPASNHIKDMVIKEVLRVNGALTDQLRVTTAKLDEFTKYFGEFKMAVDNHLVMHEDRYRLIYAKMIDYDRLFSAVQAQQQLQHQQVEERKAHGTSGNANVEYPPHYNKVGGYPADYPHYYQDPGRHKDGTVSPSSASPQLNGYQTPRAGPINSNPNQPSNDKKMLQMKLHQKLEQSPSLVSPTTPPSGPSRQPPLQSLPPQFPSRSQPPPYGSNNAGGASNGQPPYYSYNPAPGGGYYNSQY